MVVLLISTLFEHKFSSPYMFRSVLSATNLSDLLVEVNEMLTVYSFSVQREQQYLALVH